MAWWLANGHRLQPYAPQPPPVAFRNLTARVGFSDLGYAVASEDGIRQLVASFSWNSIFGAAATLAAIVANDLDGTKRPSVADLIRDLARDLQRAPDPTLGRRLRAAVDSGAAMVVEQALYTLQAFAIVDGGPPQAPDASFGQVIFLLVGINDHLDRWSGPLLDERRQLVANMARNTRFQRANDVSHALPRASIFMTAPPRGPLSDEARWNELQQRAFGMSIEQHVAGILYPLVLESSRWALPLQGKVLPELRLQQWTANVRSEHRESMMRAIEAMTLNREEAREMLLTSWQKDGHPYGTTLFYRYPFIRLPSGGLSAPSPWVVRDTIRWGLWARLLTASKKMFPKREETFLQAFGDMFERWCQQVARWAAANPAFRGQLPVRAGVEIEDVVWRDSEDVALFSIKARAMREGDAKAGGNPADVLGWLEDALFAAAKKGESKSEDRRQGALRRLSEKVSEIRAGMYEPQVPRNSRVAPVVVMYEDVGENKALYEWIRERCGQLELFGQSNVIPPSVTGVGEFEYLMGYAGNGRSPVDLLRRRAELDFGLAGMNVVLDGMPAEMTRIPELQSEFRRQFAIAARLLFDSDPGSESGSEGPDGT